MIPWPHHPSVSFSRPVLPNKESPLYGRFGCPRCLVSSSFGGRLTAVFKTSLSSFGLGTTMLSRPDSRYPAISATRPFDLITCIREGLPSLLPGRPPQRVVYPALQPGFRFDDFGHPARYGKSYPRRFRCDSVTPWPTHPSLVRRPTNIHAAVAVVTILIPEPVVGSRP